MNRKEAVLFLAGWWPDISDPHDGVFIKEHALAVNSRLPVVVIHLRLNKVATCGMSIRITEAMEDGILVVRGTIQTPIRRFGIHDFLVRLAYRRALARLLPQFRFRLAHIHVRTPMTENALWLAKKQNLQVIVTEHSSFYHHGIGLKELDRQASEKKRISRWFSNRTIRAVLPVSRDLGRILNENFGVAEEKIHVIPNVASQVFQPRLLPSTSNFRIVLAARWAGPKDPQLLTQALRLLPKGLLTPETLQIDWAGDGELLGPAMVACEDLVAMGIVNFRGRLNKAELSDLVGRSHLLVHPTKAENLPCIIIESLSCGTPVLSNAVNGIPELVDGTNGRLTPPQDPVAFAEALRWIMENYAHFDRDAIAQAAQARYSAQAVAKQIMDVYAKVLS